MHGIEEYLVAGAIVLEMIWKNGALARSLIVEKMRCTDVKPTQLEFDITKGQGIVVQPPASVTVRSEDRAMDSPAYFHRHHRPRRFASRRLRHEDAPIS
jgi:KaiC/GvpD/RAD55 family RecA-like ATPase